MLLPQVEQLPQELVLELEQELVRLGVVVLVSASAMVLVLLLQGVLAVARVWGLLLAAPPMQG